MKNIATYVIIPGVVLAVSLWICNVCFKANSTSKQDIKNKNDKNKVKKVHLSPISCAYNKIIKSIEMESTLNEFLVSVRKDYSKEIAQNEDILLYVKANDSNIANTDTLDPIDTDEKFFKLLDNYKDKAIVIKTIKYDTLDTLEQLLDQLSKITKIPSISELIRDNSDDVEEKSNPSNQVQPDDKNNQDAKPETSTQPASEKGWKKGTGYGHQYDCATWDVHTWNSTKQEQATMTYEVLTKIKDILINCKSTQGLKNCIESSCLLLYLVDALQSASIVDMGRNYRLYSTDFELLEFIGQQKHLQCLIRDDIVIPQRSSNNLWKILSNVKKQAENVSNLSLSTITKLEKDKKDKTETEAQTQTETENTEKEKIENEKTKSKKEKKKRKGKVTNVVEDDGDNTMGICDVIISCFNNINDSFSRDDETKNDDLDEKKDETVDYVKVMEGLRFKTVDSECFESHKFKSYLNESTRVSKVLVKRLATEYGDLAVSLPVTSESSIFLRVDENNMQLVKFLVVPCDDTPYASGCFVFDAYFPPDYPNVPPKVNLMTTGHNTVRFNPNLYEDGYVCLSLLGTWSGVTEGEQWQPDISTFLQVVISVQSLIFVPEPYWNEPGYEQNMASDTEQSKCKAYSEERQQKTVEWAMVDMLKNTPKEFEDVILRHFYLQKNRVLNNAKKWLGDNDSLVEELKVLLDKLDASVLDDKKEKS